MKQDVGWREILAPLSVAFAARADAADENDAYVAQNMAELKESGLLAAGVPGELGGMGLEVGALCELLAEVARGCSSTALALSMHTHQVAVNAWRWRHAKAPVGPLLERVARERLQLLSTGAGDWLYGSGEARKVEGGYRLRARKSFVSGVLSGDLLLSSAVEGGTVLHFALPMKGDGIRIEQTWRTLGMRATGSHDVLLEDAFLPDQAVSLRRPQGAWHPLFHLIVLLALPLIYSVYVGVAERARDISLGLARRRPGADQLLQQVGELENALAKAKIAHADMVRSATSAAPGMETTNRVLAARALVAEGVLQTVSAALETAGGAAFYRSKGLERLFRDAQAARYHPLAQVPQKDLAARLALGLEVKQAG
ncbi:MAG TPA: acyl-CoA dehydrogenase family protein [Burkholderiales bacterium]|nr:acyl-CoA dehydrogenase family protein [Burkholderiales bacterium]